jgi:hypothetical protein
MVASSNVAPPTSAATSQSDVTATADRPRYFTRRQAVRFINDELSLPLGASTFTKDCATGRGPIPATQFGTRLLYTAAELTRWAEARCRPVPDKAADPPADDIAAKPKRKGRPRKPRPEVASTPDRSAQSQTPIGE